MANSSRPLRAILIAFVVAGLAMAAVLYTYSSRTGAPDDVPLSGANLPEPAENR